jgi:hypothetical protein
MISCLNYVYFLEIIFFILLQIDVDTLVQYYNRLGSKVFFKDFCPLLCETVLLFTGRKVFCEGCLTSFANLAFIDNILVEIF